ncbi:unnamed protein product [Meloidogyne enterolobii]|uniref:Uncharacterized protein n=1 Tax=Meloidogyne enterolobii TaxID=390850 RepID=A0ACB0YJF0_MELEN
MLLFTQIFYFIAFLSLFLNKPIYGLLTNCLNGAPCDCDPDVIDYWEDLEFTTPSELLTTTMLIETTEKLITTMGNTTTTALPPTTEMLETTVKEETTTESAVSTTTENVETTKAPTTPTQPETTELASTSTLTTTESLPTTNITIPSTIESTTIVTTLPTTAESTTLLTTENIQTTTVEVTTTTQPTTVEPTTASTSTIMPTTTMPCVPCTVGQSLVLYDKNILNSNQSINNVPAYRCDNCNQSTISEVCYNPRNISVIRVRCTDSTLFCVCASNQKACYTVTEKAPLYEADYLIYANSSYSFLALNTGASEISNGKKTYEFSVSMTFIPNDKTFLNAPFLSGNIT